MKGAHTHQTYAELLKCAINGDVGTQVIKEFEKLAEKGATPCPRCGDMFPTHPPEHCPNHPYLNMGDQGFKAAYDAWAILEWLWAVANKIAGEETVGTVCPFCTASDNKHNWRSCLKRMKCHRNPEGFWETELPGDF